jgi:hypothetical protein
VRGTTPQPPGYKSGEVAEWSKALAC